MNIILYVILDYIIVVNEYCYFEFMRAITFNKLLIFEFIAYHLHIRTVTLNFPDFTSILTNVFIYVLKLVVIYFIAGHLDRHVSYYSMLYDYLKTYPPALPYHQHG